jgi:hypothetical protein
MDLAATPAYTFEQTETLLKFDEHAAQLQRVLQSTDDGEFARTWRLLHGGQLVDEGSRKDVLRNTLNHFVHHRGQLNCVPAPQGCSVALPVRTYRRRAVVRVFFTVDEQRE